MVTFSVIVIGQGCTTVGCCARPGRGEEGEGRAPSAILSMRRGNVRRGGASGKAAVGLLQSCREKQCLNNPEWLAR